MELIDIIVIMIVALIAINISNTIVSQVEFINTLNQPFLGIKAIKLWHSHILSAVMILLVVFNISSVDICKCLTEAGDSEYMQKNGDACRDAISKELGVDNWEKVNFSKNANLSAKFDALANKCK